MKITHRLAQLQHEHVVLELEGIERVIAEGASPPDPKNCRIGRECRARATSSPQP